MATIMGEYVDRLITVEMRNRGMNHNIIAPIYDEARREGGGRPITARAAEALVENVGEGDVVLIVTGAGYMPEVPHGESDGPPGAVSIARALYWGLKAVPVYVSEICHAPPIKASSEAAGLMIRDYELAKDRRMGAALITAPEGQSEIDAWADDLLSKMKPKAIIAIE
ncbi:MAG: glutamate cyclase domain-containing protein, partial [Halomonas sp.]